MRNFCPTCDRDFDEDLAVCPHDGSALLPIDDVDDHDPLIGRVIDGRYEIRKLLGEGGMGSVYLANQRVIDRKVCLKLLKKELLSDATVVKRFLLEAKAASRLTNPHTITIHDFGKTKDRLLYIAMEYLKGQSLREKLATTPVLSLEETARILDKVAESLAEAHDNGIVHRDLKPDNVFLTERPDEPEFVKVLDFGIARAREISGTNLTNTGVIQGTPTYMSPEVILGDPTDERLDIYALGIMAYEMLAGVAPFAAETPMQLLMRHVHSEPSSISKVNPEVKLPRSIHTFIWRCIAKDPERRPRDGRSFREDLATAMEAAAGSGFEPMDPLYMTSEGFRVGADALAELTTRKKMAVVPGPATGRSKDKGKEDDTKLAGQMTPSVYVDTHRSPWGFVLAGAVVLAALSAAVFMWVTKPATEGAQAPAKAPGIAATELAPGAETEDKKAAPAGTARGLSKETERADPAKAGAVAVQAVEAGADNGADKKISAASEVASAPVEPAPVVMANLSIVAYPRGTEVWFEGAKIGDAPLMKKVPQGDAPLSFALRKKGYTTQTVAVTPDKDQQVIRELKRVVVKRARPKKPRAKAPAKAAIPVAKPSPAPKPVAVPAPAKKTEPGSKGTMKFLP